ncbi:MAG: hypothetical protein QNI84_14695 [Henriciella sp.]|nr:hypothetical protein [Henriciella sp.]
MKWTLAVSIAALSFGLLIACNGSEPSSDAELTVPTPPIEEPVTEEAAGPTSEAAEPVTESEPESLAEPVSIEGTWGTSLAQCANFQEVMDAPMILTMEGYDQHETHCTFDTVVQPTPNSWKADGSCSVEGDDQPMSMTYTVEGDQLIQSVEDFEWAPLVRCP